MSTEIDIHQTILIKKASRSNKDMLVDNRGYSYNLKRNVPNGRDRQCVVRQKDLYCMISVREMGNNFIMGKHRHCHEGAPGVAIVKQITATVKEHSVRNVFESTGTIAERALYSMGDANLPPQIRPKLTNLLRIANRTREKLRPEDPKSCDFNPAEGYLPKVFLQADISFDGQRHLVFASQDQIDLLADVNTWYVDGAFKVFRHPFA